MDLTGGRSGGRSGNRGTNDETATALVVAHKTVASHVEHIVNKLGATRRAEIAAWAARVGGPPAAA